MFKKIMAFLGLFAFCFSVQLFASAKIEGNSPFVGSQVVYGKDGNTIVPVKVSSDGTLATSAVLSGDITVGEVDQGTGGSSAWKVDGSAVTQPVSATHLDIRHLNATDDAVVVSATHLDTRHLNVTDDAVTVSGTATVSASDLDIRALSSTTDSVAVSGTATVSGTVDVGTVTTLPAITGTVDVGSVTTLPAVTIAASQSVDVGTVTTLPAVTIAASQSVDVGSVTTLPAITGTVDVGTVTTLPAITGTVDVGTVTTLPAISGAVTVTNDTASNLKVEAALASGSTIDVGTVTTLPAITGTVSVTGVATETSLAKLTVAPGTALGSNTQAMVGGSVTTAAPSYTTGQISPLSLGTDGGLRVGIASGNITGFATENSLAKLTVAQNADLGSNTQALMGGSVTTSYPSYTTAKIQPLSLATDGTLRTQSDLNPPTGMGSNQKNVTTAGSREALAGSTPCLSVTIKAKAENTGSIYVGTAAGVSSSVGYILAKNETVTVDVDNLADVGLDASVNGEGVSYIYATK